MTVLSPCQAVRRIISGFRVVISVYITILLRMKYAWNIHFCIFCHHTHFDGERSHRRSIFPATPSQDYQSILPATVTTAPPYLDGAIFRQIRQPPYQSYLPAIHEPPYQRILPADPAHHVRDTFRRVMSCTVRESFRQTGTTAPYQATGTTAALHYPIRPRNRLQNRLQGRHSPTEAIQTHIPPNTHREPPEPPQSHITALVTMTPVTPRKALTEP